MTDDDYMMLIFLILGLGIIVIWQFLATRRLKRRVSTLELRLTQPAADSGALGAPPKARDGEVDDLRKRVQVLERIATDGNPALEREIEDLRRAG